MDEGLLTTISAGYDGQLVKMLTTLELRGITWPFAYCKGGASWMRN